jgi:hypothetical protein
VGRGGVRCGWHHAEEGGRGLAGCDMWCGGGRALVPAARESGGGAQRSGRAASRGVGEGRLAGGLAKRSGPVAEREEEGREERLTGGTRWQGEEGENVDPWAQWV